MNKLTIRQRKLLNILLSERDYKTINNYSLILGVSERTIYNDLKQIENFLHMYHGRIQKKQGVGIRLEMRHKDKLNVLADINYFNGEVDRPDIFSRRFDIITHLLLSEKPTSIQKLSEKYFVSKTSIVNDLEYIQKWFHEENIKLKKNRKGTKIIGREKDKRKAIGRLIDEKSNSNVNPTVIQNIESISNRMDLSTISVLVDMFSMTDLLKVERILNLIEKRTQCYVREPYYTNLITQMLIQIKRVQSGNNIEQLVLDYKNDDLYKMSYLLAEELITEFNLSFDKNEVIYIYRYLLGSGIDRGFEKIHEVKVTSDMDEVALEIVNKMIAVTSKVTNINLATDRELFHALLMHFKPMLYRLQHSIRITNKLLSDIKEEYSAMYAITSLASSIIESKLGLQINEDEIGYITIYFQAAVERNLNKKNIVIVCSSGIGTAELIANRIARFFPQFNIKAVTSVVGLETIDLDEVDYIISTVPIQNKSIPVCVISSLVNEIDLQNLFSIFSKTTFTDKNTPYSALLEYVHTENIYCGLTFKDKEEAITFLCTELEKIGAIEPQYKESVLNREKLASTVIGSKVAIPHGDPALVKESHVSIVTLEKSLSWGREKVDLIFLVALGKDAKSKDLFKNLYQLFNTKDILNEISSCKDGEEVYRILNGEKDMYLL